MLTPDCDIREIEVDIQVVKNYTPLPSITGSTNWIVFLTAEFARDTIKMWLLPQATKSLSLPKDILNLD